jgi:hypothetical protein
MGVLAVQLLLQRGRKPSPIVAAARISKDKLLQLVNIRPGLDIMTYGITWVMQ